MIVTRKWLIVIIPALLIKLFSLSPLLIERWYANGIYPVISKTLRLLLGWIPFSIGDLLYTFTAIWLLVQLIKTIKIVFTKKANSAWLKQCGLNIIFYMLWVYILFNGLWGLNYNRVPMLQTFKINTAPYTKTELQIIMYHITQKINENYTGALQHRNNLNKKNNLFNSAAAAYENTQQVIPALQYQFKSVKPSLYSFLGGYLGYTGYYNPFTAEAQVNTLTPVFTLPFTTCHEIGHQLGYAKENEANFAGFISAKSSTNKAFKYAVYFDMYLYGWRELYIADSAYATELDKKLLPGVHKDFDELKAYYKKFKNPVEPVVRRLYGSFLKANEQPGGIMSYNAVIGMVVGYARKYGIQNL
jgi:Protein of unknown function (DUF3810)